MTKIILTYELLEQQVTKTYIVNHLGVSRRTVIRWAQEIEKHGSLDNDSVFACASEAEKKRGQTA